MKVTAVGLNHETASLDLRGSLSFDPSSVGDALGSLCEFSNASGATILSTCNRTEFYVCSSSRADVINWISEYRSISRENLEDCLYVHDDLDAVIHATRVASGLDSMVLGETQIFGQFKDAFQKSSSCGFMCPDLARFFDIVFTVTRSVRSQTDIGAHSVSLASAVVRTVNSIFTNPTKDKVLFIGAGEMIRLCLEHFLANKFTDFTFANRTLGSAKNLADSTRGHCVSLDSIPDVLHEHNIIVSCTGSQVPILGKGLIESVLRRRKHKPLAIFDLAVPRDVEREVDNLDDVFLFTVDDLGAMVSKGAALRGAAAVEAEEIIRRHINDLISRLHTDQTISVLKKFREFGEKIAKSELDGALLSIRNGVPPEEALIKLSKRLTNKFLDRPSRALNAADSARKKELAIAVSKLFGVDE